MHVTPSPFLSFTESVPTPGKGHLLCPTAEFALEFPTLSVPALSPPSPPNPGHPGWHLCCASCPWNPNGPFCPVIISSSSSTLPQLVSRSVPRRLTDRFGAGTGPRTGCRFQRWDWMPPLGRASSAKYFVQRSPSAPGLSAPGLLVSTKVLGEA